MRVGPEAHKYEPGRPKDKQLCKFRLKGRCKNGKNCPDHRNPVCKFFGTKEGCSRGKDCNFPHYQSNQSGKTLKVDGKGKGKSPRDRSSSASSKGSNASDKSKSGKGRGRSKSKGKRDKKGDRSQTPKAKRGESPKGGKALVVKPLLAAKSQVFRGQRSETTAVPSNLTPFRM